MGERERGGGIKDEKMGGERQTGIQTDWQMEGETQTDREAEGD